jgi:uncharacterized metal-binding protein YceD (DUF177 family)
MLILSLAAATRGPVRIAEEVPADDPLWGDLVFPLKEPVRVDLEATPVGEGILVRGDIEAVLEGGCRRCLAPVPVTVRDSIDLLYEPLTDEEAADLGGEVYPLPSRGDDWILARRCGNSWSCGFQPTSCAARRAGDSAPSVGWT